MRKATTIRSALTVYRHCRHHAPTPSFAFSSFASLPRIDAAHLSDSAVRQFNDDGAIVLRQVAGAGWVEAMRDAAEENLRSPGPLCDEHAAAQGTSGRFHDDQFLWHRHGVFEEWVLRSQVGALAARAMGSRTAHVLYDQLFVKEPGTVASTPWHNDTSYWHIKGDMVCSVWVALDVVPRAQGLSYVKGSHRWGLRHRITNFSGTNTSDRNTYDTDVGDDGEAVPDVEAGAARGEYELLAWDMEPGDALLFYSAMMHGAPGVPPNSPNRRRGYATRFCGDDIVFDDRPGTMHAGWKKAGFDCGLSAGDTMACNLHPDVAIAK
mmetsp:Transcript_26961/g.60302  ORF Transcript_26961/g.60302 Transcript_26961/m.60302 type:complete len:322 (-) Transcript_26961:89-1054(-)|eukprot:CAMPEP_0172626422 /NCGR_PEP_ID=MMETSP1068-20121228/150157_1 /TAXON_ID=35684 /ORGANISM="Pseudopedinella elastica, Strain CCMP716" /LENGTH=321 /DNA_ID=CAMNT_0013436029 /DNA_START=76 /DNA_END=1041 /DNA_ORIENTATION=+